MTDIQRLRAELEAYAKAATDPKVGINEQDQIGIGCLEIGVAIREVGAELRTALDYLTSEVAQLRTDMAERANYPLSVKVDR